MMPAHNREAMMRVGTRGWQSWLCVMGGEMCVLTMQVFQTIYYTIDDACIHLHTVLHVHVYACMWNPHDNPFANNCTCAVYRITKNFRDKKLSRNAVQQRFAKKGFVKRRSVKQSGAWLGY